MLTSFFGKSAPINYVLVSGYILALSLAQYYFLDETPYSLEGSLWLAAGILALVFSMLMVDFIVRKNLLTQSNSYAVLIFASVCMMAPHLYANSKWIAANVFILLALRRMFSLKSNQNLEKKLLDSSLWLCLATINYFWAILLFIPLFFSVQLNAKALWRHFLIPPVSILGFLMLYASFYLVKTGQVDLSLLWRPEFSLDFTAFNLPVFWALGGFIIIQLLWGLFLRLQLISRVARKDRPNLLLTIYVVVAALIMVILNPEKTGGALLFLSTPLAFLVTSVIEQSPRAWLKESLLWMWVLLPLLHFLGALGL